MFIIGVVDTPGDTSSVNSIASLLQSGKLNVRVIQTLDNSISTSAQLKDYIEILGKNDTDVFIIGINHENIKKGFYNFEFDVIVHLSIPEVFNPSIEEEMIGNEKSIFMKLKRESYSIVNIDNKSYTKFLQGASTYLLTYGLNSKATVTASSIDDNDNKLSICQQRTIKTIYEKDIEPQEFVIKIKGYKERNIYSALASVSLGLVFGIGPEKFSDIIF